ncbi:hypothetical protein KSP39_PZI010339 [Platanthera zijinensis]|uniref:Uncharacterized protein n=1 Tax=Platanthera zijinensis TaxID=2320716 RepID=A0AAP0BIK5_9ASPA
MEPEHKFSECPRRQFVAMINSITRSEPEYGVLLSDPQTEPLPEADSIIEVEDEHAKHLVCILHFSLVTSGETTEPDPWRKEIFRTTTRIQEDFYSIDIDSDNMENYVSPCMVEKLGLVIRPLEQLYHLAGEIIFLLSFSQRPPGIARRNIRNILPEASAASSQPPPSPTEASSRSAFPGAHPTSTKASGEARLPPTSTSGLLQSSGDCFWPFPRRFQPPCRISSSSGYTIPLPQSYTPPAALPCFPAPHLCQPQRLQKLPPVPSTAAACGSFFHLPEIFSRCYSPVGIASPQLFRSMSKSCKGLAMELVRCLSETECVKVEDDSLSVSIGLLDHALLSLKEMSLQLTEGLVTVLDLQP